MAVTPSERKQENRHLSLDTPLGADVLVLRTMEGHEQLSKPFRLQLDTISTDAAIAHKDILGRNVTVAMDVANNKTRHFNGFVSRFELHGHDGQFAHYRAVVVPWLWFLTRTTDCRIFQDQSVPDIVQDIFREHGFTDFRNALAGNYETFEYVTQYRETDFDFVSRLLEQEGIYYFFEHEEHKHTLVLADGFDAHQACAGYEKIPFYPPDSDKALKQDYVWDWQTRQAVRPGTFALNDYDFTAPKKKLRAAAHVSREHEYADYEMYDYPGGYTDKDVGAQYSQVRIDECQADFDICQGEGNVRGLFAGGLTTLSNHPGQDHNREYLVTAVTHHAESDAMETGRGGEQKSFYRCEIELIDAKTQFRPPRVTPKGIVRGPQTAVVVGKSGEDIWTDKYGRVKLQFHWDREGSSNENSSCWVRVSQLWAGRNWGGMHVPHVGHEVIVDFLEGDPDRPIVTGRVYNADNMPPEELPTQKTKSFIRDYGDNEMVWEGKEGEQFIRINQKCGNTLFMNGKTGEEGIVLRDKCGNQISMDSTTGSMRLASPHHNSKIGLGNSIIQVSGTDKWDITHGLKGGVHLGANYALGAGAKAGIFLGTSMEAAIGAKMSATWANQLEYARGNKVSYNQERFVTLSDGGFFQFSRRELAIHGEQQLLAAGGDGAQAQIKGNAATLVLSYEKKSSTSLPTAKPGPAIKAAIVTAMGVGTHAAISLLTDEKRKDDTETEIAQKIKDSKFAAVEALGGVGVGALGVISSGLAMTAYLNEVSPVPHASPNASIVLSEHGVFVETQESADIDLETKDGNIYLCAGKKEVQVKAETVEIHGDLHVKGKGFIKNKNISVDG